MANAVARYHVLFASEIQPGRDRDAVKQNLAAALRLSAEKTETLFAGKKRVMKRTDSLVQAEAFVRVFANAGAVATIEHADGSPMGATQAAPMAATRPVAPVPGYRPFPANWLFRPALFIAALIESLLTLLYVLFLIGAVLLLVYHTLLANWLFEILPHPLLAAVAAALLLAGGSLALALLAKPLLGLIPRKEPFFVLVREVEPEFFNYVAEIAALVGAAMPLEIRVTNSAQLSARAVWGWRSLGRRDTVLTIGLPLLAGLDSRQLAALLTQALHPWRPGAGSVMGRLLDGNIHWLHRAGYEGDLVDRRLGEWQQRLPRLRPLLEKLARLAGWSARPARWRLGFSRVLSRRLVHRLCANRDLAARQIAGSQSLGEAMARSRLLAFATQSTLPELRKMWLAQGTLPDNIAQAVVAHASHYPARVADELDQLEQRRSAESGGFRPTTAQRLALVSGETVKGTYDLAAPCAAYFRRLEKLMHITTVRYYHSHLQIPVTTNKLVRTPTRGSQEYEADSRLRRFFGGSYTDFVPLRLKALAAAMADNGHGQIERWQQAVAQILAEQVRAATVAGSYRSHDEQLIAASNRELLQRAGVGSALSGLTRLKGRDAERLQQECRDAESAVENSVGEVEKLIKPYASRLAAALALLDSPPLREKMVEAERHYQEAQRLLIVHERIEASYAKLRDLRLQVILLESLLSYQALKPSARLNDRVNELADDVRRILTGFGVTYKQTPYPFETEERYANLLDWLLAQSATGEGPSTDFDRCNDTVQRMALMQRLIVGRLATLALQVESLLGLKPARSVPLHTQP